MPEQTTTPGGKSDGALQRWDPSGLLETFQQEMENFLRRPFFTRWSPWPVPFIGGAGAGTLVPRTDVYEKEGKLVFKAELPGLTKEDVQVELDGNDLVIRGESKAEQEIKDTDYYRMERTYGSFYRRLTLPFEVKPEDITASLKDGVLEVQIPKPATTKPEATKIPVS